MSDKPEWQQRYEYFSRMIEIAERGKVSALKMRCQARESGGVQCAADADPPHKHWCSTGGMTS